MSQAENKANLANVQLASQLPKQRNSKRAEKKRERFKSGKTQKPLKCVSPPKNLKVDNFKFEEVEWGTRDNVRAALLLQQSGNGFQPSSNSRRFHTVLHCVYAYN